VKWLRFVHLSGRDKLLFLKIAFMLAATRAALTFFPYKRVLGFFENMATRGLASGERTDDDRRYVDQVVFLTKAAGRRLLGTKPCLPQALVVECLYKRRGFDASLRIGVTKDENNQLLAHAWVESGGDIVIGGRLSRYRYSRMRPVESAPN